MFSIKKPDYKDTIEVQNGVNKDIRNILEKNIKRNLKEVAPFAHHFKGATELDTARNIWNYFKNYIVYKKDSPGFQDIRLARRFFTDKTGDCKSYALNAISIYRSIYPNLDAAPKYTGYAPGIKHPTHVYAVVKDKRGNEIIIDGCWIEFNSEKNFTFTLPINFMTVRTLSGIGNKESFNSFYDSLPREQQLALKEKLAAGTKLEVLKQQYKAGTLSREDALQGIAEIESSIGKPSAEQKAKRKEKAKKFWSKLGKGFLFVNLLPIRAAFNAIVAMNFNAIAHNLRFLRTNDKTKDEWKKVKKVWGNVGGLQKALDKAIDLGAKHKPIFLSKKKKAKFEERKKTSKGYAGLYDNLDCDLCDELTGIGNPAVIAAAVAAASGIIGAILPAIMKGLKKGGQPEAAQAAAEEGQELLDKTKSGELNPATGFGASDMPLPGEGTGAGMEGIAEIEDEINAPEDFFIGTTDWSGLVDGLTAVAKVGIEAGANAIAKKAKKNPKLKKVLDTANQGVEDYATGQYLRTSGMADRAKQFTSMLTPKTMLLAFGGLAVLGAGYFFIKKK